MSLNVQQKRRAFLAPLMFLVWPHAGAGTLADRRREAAGWYPGGVAEPEIGVSPGLCTVYTYLTRNTFPLADRLLEAELVDSPAYTDDLVLSREMARDVSGANGFVQLRLVRGLKYRVLCPTIGLKRVLTVPDQSSVKLGEWLGGA